MKRTEQRGSWHIQERSGGGGVAVVSGGSHSLAGDVVATFTEMTWILDPGL